MFYLDATTKVQVCMHLVGCVYRSEEAYLTCGPKRYHGCDGMHSYEVVAGSISRSI